MNIPRIGVGVIVKRGNKILLGKRKGAHGEGTWCFPGGHLEFKERIGDCAKREVLEETGIKIKNILLGPYTNDFFEKENRHYITLFAMAEYESGKVEIMEPKKCEKWEWFSWDKLPKKLFTPVKNLIKSGYNPFLKQ